jgi:hypothetical protein
MHNGGVLLTLKAIPIRPCSVPALDTVFITLTFPVGVVPDATAGFDVSILPNPTAGLFNLFVRGSMNKELSIIISDIAGKTIFRDQDRPLTQEYSRAIDLTGFPRGIYFIKAQTDVHLITKKLVIQ